MSTSRPRLLKIKEGAIRRGAALARVSASAGARVASHWIGGLFQSNENREDRKRSLLLSQVELLTRELGELKGSLMKVGQMLSIVGEQFLPPEVNAVLKSLQSQSPPLAWESVAPVLKRQLGEKLSLLEIDSEPVASASLGQVHRAKVKADGRVLALKVQYPGVDRAIDSDLRALRTLLSVSKLLPKREAARYDELFAEVRQMLRQEVDYKRELEETLRYRELLLEDSRYVVPNPVPEFSTGRVLATEYQEGLSLDSAEVSELSQERRNAIAMAILELHFRELFEWGSLQTDPHFGNFKLRLGENGEPDRIVLLDFGAVRKFSSGFLKSYAKMVLGVLSYDARLLEEGAVEMDFLRAEDTPAFRDAFSRFCFLFAEPFQEAGSYRFGESDLPARVAKEGMKLALTMKLRKPPREVIFLDRKLAGLFVILARLGADINGRECVERYASKFASRHPPGRVDIFHPLF